MASGVSAGLRLRLRARAIPSKGFRALYARVRARTRVKRKSDAVQFRDQYAHRRTHIGARARA
jgi:hypothetical protein